MSQSQDEARAARIQKIKEERRKQLTAQTACLFSANVTDRRKKRSVCEAASQDTSDHLKSSSEINLTTATTSVPIRSTRTSRLRAAAACQSDSSTSLRRSNRSSSIQSLEEEKTKTRSSKLIDRDKNRTNSRRLNEKENFKSVSTTCFSEKDNGASRLKPKHSISKNTIEKDKINNVGSSKERNVVKKSYSSTDEKIKLNSEKNKQASNEKEKPLLVNGVRNFDEVLDDNVSNVDDKDKFEDLFEDLVIENNNVQIIGLKLNDNFLDDGSRHSHIFYIPDKEEAIALNGIDNIVKSEESVVPNELCKQEAGSLLDVVCVPKVERFSELLSNLCSPSEADVLFDDILENGGFDGVHTVRKTAPECTAPCRRTQPPETPNVTAPKRAPPIIASDNGKW